MQLLTLHVEIEGYKLRLLSRLSNLDLVTDNVYTNFGLILSIRSQDIEQKPNFEVNQGP